MTKGILAKIKSKWAEWTIGTILIINLLRQLLNFLGVAIEGHYTRFEAVDIICKLDQSSQERGFSLINNLMQCISREAVLNLGFAIFVVAVYLYYIRKKRN